MVFAVVFAVAFFGIQFFTKTGVFRVPGVVYYDESLKPEELAKLQAIFTEDVELDKDVTISAKEYTVKPELGEGEFLYDIYVPVADFYEERTDVNELTGGEYHTISIEELDFTQKLLAVDGEYYLDNFNNGATFRVISFDSDKYNEEIAPLVAETFTKEWPEKDTVLTIAQTGVTALSRGMNEKLNSVGDATYFAEKIKDYLTGFDLTHTSNESSFTEMANSKNICSDPRFINTLTAIGLDIVELTGNHNQDCGDDAALETIDLYEQNGIKIVGGGRNAEEAAIPLEINEKVYTISCRILGGEHPLTLTSLNNLAYTYGELGEHKKALEMNEKVYTLRCRILGDEHPDTLTSLSNLASTYGYLREHQKALEMKEKVYTIRCRILGEEHPDTLRSLSNLAYTYSDLGEHKKSLELLEKVYESRKRILGEEHPDTLTTLNNLTYVKKQMT